MKQIRYILSDDEVVICFRQACYGMVIGLLLITTACSTDKVQESTERAYPVEVKVAKMTSRVRQMEYFGVVSANIINYSFSAGGRVDQIFVKKNQFIRKGTKLMQLETTGYNLALNAVKHQEVQAKQAYYEAKAYFSKLQKASQNGGVSDTDLDKAKLDRDIKQRSWEQSKIDIQAKHDHLNQATLIAKTDGIVSDINPQVGEMVGAGTETMIIKDNGIFVETAISQKDLDFINTETRACIRIKDQVIKGKVSYIAGLPDMQTFRHTVKIEFPRSAIKHPVFIGMTAKVIFETEMVSGFWLPVNYISNDGGDFVHVVENSRMRKKKVQIIDYSNDLVRVHGLTDNEPLITKGARHIKEGYKVKIVDNAE